MKQWAWGACLVGLLITAEAQGVLIDPATATFQWEQPVAPVPVTSCVTSAASWQNVALAAQTTDFTTEFDATPQGAAMDGVVGLSSGAALDYTALAAIVQFSTAGTIMARNGGVYAASTVIPYVAGTTYHVRLVVSFSTHTYSAYVRVGTGTEAVLASGFAFRTEQAAASSLNNLSAYAGVGSETVCTLVAPAPPSSSAITGYTLKCGTVTGVYGVTYAVILPYAPVPVNKVVSSPNTYFCVVTAGSLAGESVPSNEVTFQVATAAYPPAAPILRVVP